MVEKTIKFLVRNAMIEPAEMEIYQYGLALLIKKILHVFVIFFIGFLGGEFFGVLVFLTSYASIREYAGGYHAKTELGCYFCTGIVTVSTLFLIHIFHLICLEWVLLLLFSCGTAIWFLSPQEAHNKPLEIEEKLVYRKKAHLYLILEGIVCLSGFIYKSLLYGVACAWTIQVTMFLAGMICKKR